MKRLIIALLWVLASADPASALEFTGRFVQGGLVVGHTVPQSSVTVDGRAARVSDLGEFLVGLARDATGTVAILAISPNPSAISSAWSSVSMW